MSVQRTDLRPSINPSDEEIAAWESLNREEQLESIRTAIDQSAASGLSSQSAAEIFEQARSSVSSRDA